MSDFAAAHGDLADGLGTTWAFGALRDLRCAGAGLARRWLSQRELGALARWKHPERRQERLLARLMAKRLALRWLGERSDGACCGAGPRAPAMAQGAPRAAEIEILTASGGRPEVWLQGQRQPWSISIAHAQSRALVALCPHARSVVGVDLVALEGPAPPAQRLWYTPREQARVRRSLKDPVVNGRAAWRAAWMWAAKEALYKVCNRGEGFDPRQTEILAQAWWYRTRSWAPPERVCWKNAAQLALMIWIPETHLTQVHP